MFVTCNFEIGFKTITWYRCQVSDTMHCNDSKAGLFVGGVLCFNVPCCASFNSNKMSCPLFILLHLYLNSKSFSCDMNDHRPPSVSLDNIAFV